MKTILAQRVLSVEVSRTEITEHSYGKAYRSVPDGELTGTVTLRVDIDALVMKLGDKALRSIGGKARGMGGLVEVTVARKTVRRTKPE